MATLTIMASLINQYSALIPFIILGIGILAVIVRRLPAPKRRLGAAVAAGVFLIAGLIIFQPVHEGDAGGEVEAVLAVGQGRPVLLELYSDY